MHNYQVNLNWLEGRKGEISSPELTTKIEVATPPAFPGGVEGIWSPEHLLTAAVNSCFMTTFLAIAENSKLAFKKFSCTSEGILDQVEGKYLMTEIILKPQVELVNEADKERAERILQKSEKACLISNSIKSKVTLVTTIEA
ncbi:OsmC family protein [Aurantibacillus circumpalustris]|uniref:OsmC family protein n=1 Tax=Aurantibacillus circumpalustris TaxID=3036359 RepID=UPI00295B4D84|nr:OsmC family protein [Aurantibacillus circumpalustris]